jgi:hypothetical protein
VRFNADQLHTFMLLKENDHRHAKLNSVSIVLLIYRKHCEKTGQSSAKRMNRNTLVLQWTSSSLNNTLAFRGLQGMNASPCR